MQIHLGDLTLDIFHAPAPGGRGVLGVIVSFWEIVFVVALVANPRIED